MPNFEESAENDSLFYKKKLEIFWRRMIQRPLPEKNSVFCTWRFPTDLENLAVKFQIILTNLQVGI